MSDGLEELKRVARAMGSAPIALSAVIILLVASIWGAIHWSYRMVLAGKDAHIASIERQLADYRDKLNGASPEEARGRIEALEADLKMLRIRLTPRRLTLAQREAISDHSLRPSGTSTRAITVTVQEGCSDCTAFAAEISDALAVAGNWTTTIQTVTNPNEHPRSGLAIRVAEPTRPSAEAVVLQQALQSAGLAFSMLTGGAGSGVELLVTERAP